MCVFRFARHGGRDNVVINPAVLVVDDQQQRAFPLGTFGQDVIDIGDELFTAVDGKIGMLAVGIVAGVVIVIPRLNEGVCREISVERIGLKLAIVSELCLMLHEVPVGHQDRCTRSVNLVGVDGIRSETLEDRLQDKGARHGILRRRACRTGAMHEHPVGYCGSGNG